MKRKVAIFNLMLMALVQFTMAFQSFHAFSHHAGHKEHTEHHEVPAKYKAVVSADDHEDCHVCDFHFDFFTAPQQFHLTLSFAYTHIPYTYSIVTGVPSFAPSFFSLRAPPALV